MISCGEGAHRTRGCQISCMCMRAISRYFTGCGSLIRYTICYQRMKQSVVACMSGTRLFRYMSAKHIPGRNERPSLAKRSAFMLWSTCSIVIILCLSVVALSLKAEQCPATSDLQHINATQFDSTDYSEREFMTACRNEDVAVFTVARVYAGMCTPD